MVRRSEQQARSWPVINGLQQNRDESLQLADIANIVAREVGMPINLSMMIQAGLPTMTFGSMGQLIDSTPFEEQIGSAQASSCATYIILLSARGVGKEATVVIDCNSRRLY